MLGNHRKRTALLKSFRKEDDGATALTFALGLFTLLGAIGMGMDISVANKNKSKAQNIADSVALNAAVFVRDNKRSPLAGEDGFQHGVSYDASQVGGFDFGTTIVGNVTFKVDYDMNAGNAVVTVNGKSKTSLTSLFGYQHLNFSATSTALFLEKDLRSPASIVFIADNSGSMNWDDKQTYYSSGTGWLYPSDSTKRIDALETAMKNFMTTLDQLVGPQNVTGERVLRTGLLAFDDAIITQRTQTMQWGTLSNGNIESMSPSGATNSSPPMAEAKVWLDAEQAVHTAETNETALKYAIFLTDGVNTSGGYTWYADDTADYWRKRICTIFGCWWSQFASTYDYTALGYEEGEYRSNADTETSATCQAMENAGYRVFTIGFALDPGYYYDGTGNKASFSNYAQITTDESNAAYALLGGCVDDPNDFVKAADADQLDAAFTKIGNTIVQEIIRISS